MSLLSRGIRVLRRDGFRAFVRKTLAFLSSNLRHERLVALYWTLKRSYSLTLGATTVQFSSPNETVVHRNRARFETEKEILGELLREIQDDDVFYDVGANTGLYTLFAAKNCSRVVSFEPYPPNADLLERDAERNSLSNVELYRIALSDSDGEVSFSQPETDDIGFGSASIETGERGNSVTVPTRSGDSLIAEDALPQPTVLKIDVEGSEPLVIEGLQEALSRPSCRLVFCEVHLSPSGEGPSVYDYGGDLDGIEEKLRSCGFTVEEVKKRGTESLLRCRK